MKLIHKIIFLVLTSSAPFISSAESIEAFDGFDWGTSRSSIIEVRGKPFHVSGTIMLYTDVKDKIGGYKVDDVFYVFKEGCSKLKESISEHCQLWYGAYALEVNSEQDFKELTKKISSLYGDYTVSQSSEEVTDYNDETVLAIETETTHRFQQADGSAVEVLKKEYDRDLEIHGNDKEAGIFSIAINYMSSEYTQNQKRKKIKNKDF